MILQGNQGQTGKQFGQNITAGMGEFSDILFTELQPRFYEQTVRGNTYSTGMQITSVSNATFSTADGLSGTLSTAATSTPVVGLWNPSNSGVNAVILQAVVPLIITALQVTGTGPLVWAVYAGQTANITTSVQVPVNRKTFTASGSQCRGVTGIALTGLQNTGNFLAASAIDTPALNLSTLQTAAGLMPFKGNPVENLDGSIVIVPGSILALYTSGTPVAISAASSLLWEEVPVTV
jgi:hypothetical protein